MSDLTTRVRAAHVGDVDISAVCDIVERIEGKKRPSNNDAVTEFECEFAASHGGRLPRMTKASVISLSAIRKELSPERYRDVCARYCLDVDPWVVERDHAPNFLAGQLPRILRLVSGQAPSAPLPKGYSASILTGSQEGGWKPANDIEAERFERMRRGEMLDD